MQKRLDLILNEAKGVQRTISSSLWATVSSTCSKNKDTEAEFIKPIGKTKDDKDELIQRYAAALLIMKKPCPSTVAEIEQLKTFKLVAQRALELGATIADFQRMYVKNGGQLDPSVEMIEEPSDVMDDEPVINEPTNDFPSYDDVNIGEEPTSNTENNQNVAEQEPNISFDSKKQDFPAYDDVNIDDTDQDTLVISTLRQIAIVKLKQIERRAKVLDTDIYNKLGNNASMWKNSDDFNTWIRRNKQLISQIQQNNFINGYRSEVILGNGWTSFIFTRIRR